MTDKSYRQFINEASSEVSSMDNVQVINEAKLSRVLHHFKSADRAIGIISRFRDARHSATKADGSVDERRVEANHQHNLKANQETARVFRKNGFGYVWVDGVWIENEGTKDERKASEVSIFVTAPIEDEDKLLALLIQEGKKKSKVDGQPQDAIIFQGSDGKIKIIDPTTKKVDVSLNNVSVDKISFAYTRLRSGSHRGRTFVFESIEERTTWAGKLIETHKTQGS